MRHELLKKMEMNFDPTDSNAASDVAEGALKVMEIAARALRDNHAGMRMGRDNATELSVAIMETAKAMGLLGYHFSAKESEELFEELCR